MCVECVCQESGNPSIGELHSRNSRATKKLRIEATELELTRLKVDHGLLFQKHETLRQESKKLQRQVTKLLAVNATLKTATDREHLLRDVQSQLQTTHDEGSRLKEDLHTKDTRLDVMLCRAKQHEEFRRLYGPILRDTVKRQMQIHQLKMRTFDFSNGRVLDGRGEQTIEMPVALERDTWEGIKGQRTGV